MTFNLRYDNPSDGENRWELRKQEVAEMILHYRPSIVGIQEGLYDQVVFLASMLAGYRFIGAGRDDGFRAGEYSAVFYDSTHWSILRENTFWLSQNPHTVSKGWDAACNRICTYGAFRHRISGDTFFVFNTHFDHVGKLAREKSSELIRSVMDSVTMPQSRVIVMGDFNAEPDDASIRTLKLRLQDSREISAQKPYGPAGTFNGFATDKTITKRIDYILTKNLAVKEHLHIDDRRQNQLYLSDHLPVFVLVTQAAR